MRSFVALLSLLLALPGLLLPAGVLWHLCGCEERGLPAQSCCARANETPTPAVPVAPTAVRSCCAGKAKAPSSNDTPHFVADDCACEWLPIADEQPVRNTPEPPPILLALPPQHAFAPPAAVAAGHAAAQSWTVVASRPPPPDARRSLPLRL